MWRGRGRRRKAGRILSSRPGRRNNCSCTPSAQVSFSDSGRWIAIVLASNAEGSLNEVYLLVKGREKLLEALRSPRPIGQGSDVQYQAVGSSAKFLGLGAYR